MNSTNKPVYIQAIELIENCNDVKKLQTLLTDALFAANLNNSSALANYILTRFNNH